MLFFIKASNHQYVQRAVCTHLYTWQWVCHTTIDIWFGSQSKCHFLITLSLVILQSSSLLLDKSAVYQRVHIWFYMFCTMQAFITVQLGSSLTHLISLFCIELPSFNRCYQSFEQESRTNQIQYQLMLLNLITLFSKQKQYLPSQN